MADNLDELRGKVARLHEQLSAAPNVSGESRELLAGVLDDIHALLSKTTPGGEPPPAPPKRPSAQHDSIVARLSTAEQQFEATHPTLAGIVGSIIDALGRMGI